MPTILPFTKIDDLCAAGEPVPAQWRPMQECRCLVLVGLTGVGKTTVLNALLEKAHDAVVLPNRRTVTDLLMFPEVQAREGLPVQPVTDREQRFEMTRRYREWHPGGMAYALTQLSIAPDAQDRLLIFDGLRGENEIRHAVEYLPAARYLMLDAPDVVRIERLVKRQDAFDVVASNSDGRSASADTVSFESLGLPELAEILTHSEQQRLIELVNTGAVGADELAARGRIVLSERRSYDPASTRAALEELASDRSLIVDTDMKSPEQIVADTIAWMNT